MLVDSSVSGHYFDDAIPGLRDKLDNYQVLDVLGNITTARGQMDGVTPGLLLSSMVKECGTQSNSWF